MIVSDTTLSVLKLLQDDILMRRLVHLTITGTRVQYLEHVLQINYDNCYMAIIGY
jgi:hypothetical protein